MALNRSTTTLCNKFPSFVDVILKCGRVCATHAVCASFQKTNFTLMEKVFNIRVFPPPPPPSFNASLGVYEEERVREKGRKGEGESGCLYHLAG